MSYILAGAWRLAQPGNRETGGMMRSGTDTRKAPNDVNCRMPRVINRNR